MFSGLRERLQAARDRLGASIGAAAEAARPVARLNRLPRKNR